MMLANPTGRSGQKLRPLQAKMGPNRLPEGPNRRQERPRRPKAATKIAQNGTQTAPGERHAGPRLFWSAPYSARGF